MSVRAVTVDARDYRVRLVQPDADGSVTFLGRTWSGTFLPTSASKDSPDLVEGTYTRREGDAGEFRLTFPNSVSSDGVLWRERFDPEGALQWIEIYRGLDLEYVGPVERVEVDRGQVVVSGGDGWSMLKRAYERDRVIVAGPTQVIHDYSRVPRMVVGNDFDASVGGANLFLNSGIGSVTGAGDGYVKVDATAGATDAGYVEVADAAFGASQRWRATATFPITPATGGGNWSAYLIVYNLAGTDFQRVLFHSTKTAHVYADYGGYTMAPPSVPVSADTPLTLVLEAQGDLIRGYVNGALVGYLGNFGVDQIQVAAGMSLETGQVGYIDMVTVVDNEPFLQGSTPEGAWRSPGDLPVGGLRGRYRNDADLKNLAVGTYEPKSLSPERDVYGERLDPQLSSALTLPMTPGSVSTGEYWAVRWTGSVYLGAAGSWSYNLSITVAGAVRLRIADMDTGLALIGTTGVSGSFTNPDAAAGWFPIIVDALFVGITATQDVTLTLTPPASYTDPGGTSWTSGVAKTVPSSSLSPLGVYENRAQGSTHFDLVKSAAKDFGYELLLEPRSLESGEFPGILAPSLRVGRDTDVVLTVEEDEHGTPILAPGVTRDGSELTTQLIGSAQGINFGRGDVNAEVTDIAASQASLFTLQSWVDAGEIGFTDLLAARLNAELALRATPWEEVRGNPIAQDRLADTFPLSDTLSAFRWSPGDGVRIVVPDVGVEDTSPRRLTQVTRTFAAEGRSMTQVGLRNRPRGAAVSIAALARASLKPLRAKTAQLVTLPSEPVNTTIAVSGGGSFFRVFLDPSDKVVRAYIRCGYTAVPLWGVEINSTDVTTALGGPWVGYPVVIDVTPYALAHSASDTRFYARILDKAGYDGGGGQGWEGQMFVEVLR